MRRSRACLSLNFSGTFWIAPIDVDVFLAETQYQQQVLQRRQSHATERGPTWFVSPEDLVLLNLLAHRPKDQVNVIDNLFMQGQLDVSYMRTWANHQKIGDQLEAAIWH